MPEISEIEKYYSNLLIIFGRINIAIMLFPIIITVSWSRNFLNKPLKVFLYYCIATFFINLLEQLFIWSVNTYPEFWIPILTKIGIGDTNFLQILYYLKDFAFLGWFYSLLLPWKYSSWIKRLAALFFIAALINYFFIEGHNVFGIFNPAADAIFSFVLPAFYLWYLFRHMLNFPVHKNPYFWISFGLVFTNLIGLFLYLAGDAMHEADYILFAKVSIGRNIFDMMAQVIFAIGFWYAPYAKYLPLPNEKVTTI